MRSEENRKFRKISRDFKGKLELMKRTPLEDLEEIFLEMYELGLKDYIRVEKKRYPNKTRKEIILDMYKLHDKIKNSSR
ncbi:MAG TPA: hypothetical protein VGB37_15785 [Candidatus Lokiarchaeia archaeon]